MRPHGYEPLEYRMLLAADLQLPSGLTSEEIVLSYSTSASQYQLLQNGIVVSTATAASASSGGVRISGNAADNSLKLDIARLPAVAITLLGNGQDRLAIMDDSNMTVHSDRVIVGSKTYPITGFERLELSGGPSSNHFQVVTSSYESIQIIGGDGSDTLTGPNVASSWTIISGNAGMLNESIQFSAIENITGGNLKDIVRVMSSEGLSGVVDGGTGTNELQGPDSDAAWQILGSNTGKLNGKNFTNFASITGGSKDDTFVIGPDASLTGKLDGGRIDPDDLSVNSLDYSTRGAAVEVDLSTTQAPGFPVLANMNRFVGQGTASKLKGPIPAADQATWVITGANSGEVAGTKFEGFAHLAGQDSLNDAFVLKPNGSISGLIDGGILGLDGVAVELTNGDLLAYQPSGADIAGQTNLSGKAISFSGLDLYEPLSGTNQRRIFTGSIFDRSVEFLDADLNSSGQSMLRFQGLSFTSGSNSYAFPNPTQLLYVNLGSGPDRIVEVSMDPGLATNYLKFEDGLLVADLTQANDVVDLQLVSGSLNDGAAVDLSINGIVTRVGTSLFAPTTIQIRTQSGDDTVTLGHNIPNTVEIDGGSGTDTLVGPNVDFEWVIDGPNSGQMGFDGTFTGVETLTGGSAKDQFTFRGSGAVTGSLTGQIYGGAGSDTVIGPESDNQWIISGGNAGVLNATTTFSAVENVSGGGAADTFIIQNSGSISGSIDGGIDRETAPGAGPASDSIDYSQRTSSVTVNLGTRSSSSLAAAFRIENWIGTSSIDTLIGPGEPGSEVKWNISSSNTGSVSVGVEDNLVQTQFQGFENLQGRDATSDRFRFLQSGQLSGTVAGGLSNDQTVIDSLSVSDGTIDDVFQPSTAEQSGSVTLKGRTVTFTGLDPFTVLTGSAANRVISGSMFSDELILEDDSSPNNGQIKLSFPRQRITSDGSSYNNSFVFSNPSESLTIKGLGGKDVIRIKTLDSNFAASLIIFGATNAESNSSGDEIRFEGNLATRGGDIQAVGQKIIVEPSVTLSTAVDEDLTLGGDIDFLAIRFGTAEIENLLPSGYIAKSASINVGTNAVLRGKNVLLNAQTEDRALQDVLGLTTLQSNFFVDPFLSKLQDLIALPLKVLVKSSESNITIQNGSQIYSAETTGIGASAGSDSSSIAKSAFVSIGYSQATAKAQVDIRPGVKIHSDGSIDIGTSATTKAATETETSKEEEKSAQGRSLSKIAASVGASWANLVSTITVAQGAEVIAGRRANIASSGETETETVAASGLYANGTAAIALGLQFSTATVKTDIQGKVIAQQKNLGPIGASFEFDPTIPASIYKTSDSAPRITKGDTVQSTSASGTIYRYIGPGISPSPGQSSIDLSTLTYTGNPHWEVSSEPAGYVDTVRNRIAIYDIDVPGGNISQWATIADDIVVYSSASGKKIDGLIGDGETEYYVVRLSDKPSTAVDESRYIQLAKSKDDALAAADWDSNNATGTNPHVIDLGAGATVNKRSFDAGSIDDGLITLSNALNRNRPFEDGQTVVYLEPGRTIKDRVVATTSGDLFWQSPNAAIDATPYVPAIGGGSSDWKSTGNFLQHGQKYLVTVEGDVTNETGTDSFTNAQKIRLTSASSSGWNADPLSLGSPTELSATGFTLSAVHSLESVASLSITAELSASNAAEAEAGFSPEEEEEPEDPTKPKEDDKGFDWDKSIFDNLFFSSTDEYQAKSDAGGSNAKSSLQVGGGLAFHYSKHDVQVVFGSTSVVQSNDNLEVSATLEQSFTTSTESTAEEQPGKKDADGKDTPNTSADNSVVTAIGIGLFNNLAKVTVENGAQLDALLEMSLSSEVQYPFLTKIEEFIPLSIGDFSDRLNEEGFDFINNYLDGTGGLKSLFNSWARSTTSADGIGISGSINFLDVTNDSTVQVKTGAKLNQNTLFRPDPRFFLKPGDVGYNPNYDPAVDNDDINYVRHANNVDAQSVLLSASTLMEMMHVTGVFNFQLPSAEIGSINGIDDADPAFDINATPTRGGKGGVGGTLFLQFLDNSTQAIVEKGAQIYTGTGGGLSLSAQEALMGFSFSQGGASSEKLAFGGTFTYYEQDSQTIAQISEGANIQGGGIDVYSGAIGTQIAWAGGVSKSESIGAGVSVAINNLDRETRASIGEKTDSAGTLSGNQSTINAAGGVSARAAVGGALYAFTIAGAYSNAAPAQDTPQDGADGNAPTAQDDPLDGVSLPNLFNEEEPTEQAQEKKSKTSVAIAAAVAVNNIKDRTQASIADVVMTADAVDVKAVNRNSIVAATGGLAASKTESGGTGAALAGAFSFNSVDSITNAFIRDSIITLSDVPIEDLSQEDYSNRFSVSANNMAKIFSLAAGGAGSVAKEGTEPGNTTNISLAGSVAKNSISGGTFARVYDSTIAMQAGTTVHDAVVRARDASNILAIAGSLSMSMSKGGTAGATAVSAGVAIAVNSIAGDTVALVSNSTITGGVGSTGTVTVESISDGEIQAYTVSGALSAASSKQTGSGIGASGAGAGSVNKIDVDTTATVENSTIDVQGNVVVKAQNTAKIIAGAGAVAIGIGSAVGQGQGGAVAIGGSFSVNQLDGDGAGNLVVADVNNSNISTAGSISVLAEMAASIFAVGIGASGGVASSTTGTAFAVSVAGSIGVNRIRNQTQSKVRSNSTVTTRSGSSANKDIRVSARDNSSIDAVSGSAAVSLSRSQSTSVAVALGLSLSLNEITGTTHATVTDSTLNSAGGILVLSDADASIKSIAFGISVGVALSSTASSVSVGSIGAVSYNTIDSDVRAAIENSSPTNTRSVSANGNVIIAATDDSQIEAFGLAASANISGSTSATGVSVGVGLALGSNTIDKDVVATVLNVPTFSTSSKNLTVEAKDTSRIDVDSYAASVAVSIGSTAIAVSGGSSAATNSVSTRVNATIENSVVGTPTTPVGKVDVLASSESIIDASVGVGSGSVAFSRSGAGVGVAVGIAVSRNFIGSAPTGGTVTGTIIDATSTPVSSLTKGMKVKLIDGPLAGEIYEYVGNTVNDSDPIAAGNQKFDLKQQQYRDPSLWKHINSKANASEIKAFIKNASIVSNQPLKVQATSSQSIDSTVVGTALGIAVSKDVGVGVSAAGTYAENRSLTDIVAMLDGNGSIASVYGVQAAGVSVLATDTTTIDSKAVSGAIAAGFGNQVGVGVAVGISLAYNDIQNDVTAEIADYSSVTSTNGITVSAKTLSGEAPPSSYTSSSGTQTLSAGNTVKLASDYSKGGIAGRQYRYRGFTADFDITSVNFTNSSTSAVVFQGDLVRVNSGAIYKYVGDDNENQGRTLNLTSQNYADSNSWELAQVTLKSGNTVRTGLSSFYRYIGPEEMISLGQSTYTDTSRWQSISPNSIALGSADYSDSRLWEISDGSITSTSVAASFAGAYGSQAGVGVSGAGAASRNRILSKSNALISDTNITGTGSVRLQSQNTSKIDSKVISTSAALGASGNTGIGVSIGIGVAENFIGWNQEGIRSPAQVRAILSNSHVSVSGTIELDATNASEINALVFAGSAAIAGGGQVGVGVSGAGVGGINKIATDVQALINSDRKTDAPVNKQGIFASAIHISAVDSAKIDALAGAATVAAAFGNTGVGVSIGIAVAENFIQNDTLAGLLNTDSRGITSGGSLSVVSESNAAIRSTAVAASLAISAGNVSVAVSGGSAAATNTILSSVESTLDNALAGSDSNPLGSVALSAVNASTIQATVGVGSASVAAGGGPSVGVSLGASVARNFIGITRNTGAVSGTITDASSAPLNNLTPGLKVRLIEGALAGEIYEYIGSPTSDADPNVAGNQKFDLSQQPYRDSSRWKHINSQQQNTNVRSTVRNSRVISNGSMTVTAQSSQAIESLVVGVSTGIGVSAQDGVAVSAAGSYAENVSRTNIIATIDGASTSGTTRQTKAHGIEVSASDSSRIDSLATGASLAVAFGAASTGTSVSIGISLAYNTIQNDVSATIINSSSVHSTSGISVHSTTSNGTGPTAKYNTSSGTKTLEQNDTVELGDSYSKGGQAGRTYRYRGFTPDYDIFLTKFSNTVTNARVFQGDLVRVSGAAIYSYLGDDNNGQGVTLNLTNQNYLDSSRWQRTTSMLREGNTVRTGASSYFRYIGPEENLSLGQENYANSSRWQAFSPNTYNLGAVDYSNTKLWEIADGSITATSIAASMSGAFGLYAGTSISGAGATARNRVLSKTNALVQNSTMHSTGNVELQSLNASKIDAKVIAASVALGSGGFSAVGVSIGVATAENLIGWMESNEESPSEIRAGMINSGVNSGGNLSVLARDLAEINALVFSGSAALSAGAVGVSASGAGTSGTNRISTDIEALIDGDNRTGATGIDKGVKANSIQIQAVDASRIEALAGAASLAASYGGTGVAVSVGVATSENRIDNNTTASISNADDRVQSLVGGVVITATSNAKIDATALAATLAAGAGNGYGVAVSGGGAISENRILSLAVAAIEQNSNVISNTDLLLNSISTSGIESEVISASAAVGVGGSAGVGVSLGFGVARNLIGWDTQTTTFSNLSSLLTPVNLTANYKVKVDGGVRDQEIYQYVGPTRSSVLLYNEDFGDVRLWKRVDLAKSQTGARAYIANSSIDVNDQLEVLSTLDDDIDAIVVAGSVAAGFSSVTGVGVGVAGAGVGVENRIASTSHAIIDGDSNLGILSGSILLNAVDQSNIDAKVGSASLAMALGGLGAGVAISVSMAHNLIDNDIRATINNADNRVGARTGSITVSASEDATIDATTSTAAIGAAGGLIGVAVSGAGAHAINVILSDTIAWVDNSKVDAVGNLIVEANSQATVDAQVAAISASVAGGEVGVGIAIGVSLAENYIGFDESGNASASLVQAIIEDSQVTVSGNIQLNAESDNEVASDVQATSVAAAIGKIAGAGAGAGVSTINLIGQTTESYLRRSIGSGISAANVSLSAQDNSRIHSEAQAGSLAAAFGVGGAVSVAVTIAENRITSQTNSSIQSATVVASNNILVEANQNSTLSSEAYTAAFSAGLFAASGGGAESKNTIDTSTNAKVLSSSITATGDLTVDSQENSDASSYVGTLSIAAGLISIAAGGSVTTVLSRPTVIAEVNTSTVHADEIIISATTTPVASAESFGVNAGTLAIGVSKSELTFAPNVNATVGGTIRSRTLWVDSQILEKSGVSNGDVLTTAGAGGLIGVDATLSRIYVNGTVNSSIANNANLIVTGDSVINALGMGSYYSKASSNAFGILAAGVSSSNISADVAVQATVGSSVVHQGGTLSINAVRDVETFSDTVAGSGGVAAGASASSDATQTGTTTASVGQNAQLSITGDFKVNSVSTSQTNGRVLAVSGGLLAGAGARVWNFVNTPVNANIASGAIINAGSIEVDAGGKIRKPNIGTNISGTTGGLVSGASTRSETVVNLNTIVDVGTGAQLTVTTESGLEPLALRALNDIQGYDKVTFTTGGAISGAGADSVIRTQADLARVNVGNNARLTATGDILISARGTGDVDTNTNVDTYGAATVAVADTRTDIRPVNQIEFQSNSRVFAEGNILVSAGTDASFNRDRYKMRSRADSFAGSAIPIDDIDALAKLLQTNTITVNSSSNIISERDIKLHAERFGFADMWAQAKAVNWASATASAINSALGGSELLAGDVDSSALGVVTVNGRLETGVKRNVTVTLGALNANNQPTGWNPETRVVTAIQATEGVRINQNLAAMKSTQEQELINARENLARYGSNDATLAAYYRSELTRIGNELVAQGLGAYDPDGEIRFLTVDVMNVNIEPVWAQAGIIDIRGDSLLGTGVIHPPGDAAVNILNYTPAQLTIKGITIPEINGGLYLNGTLATDNAAVRDLSENKTASFSQITPGGGASANPPRISVKNTFEATDYVIPDGNYRSNQGTVSLAKYQSVTVSAGHTQGGTVGTTYIYLGNNGSVNLTSQNYANATLWSEVVNDYVDASIVVVGDITNYSGTVKLEALGRNANISIQASVKAADVSVIAGGAVFIEGLTSYHVGGDPYGKLKTIGNGISAYDSTTAVNLMTTASSTVNLRADSISVSAEFINLNGIIQSGKSSYSLTLDSSVTSQIQSILRRSTPRYTALTVSNSDFKCFYDRVDNKIIVKEIRVGGGRIDLTGNLLNTGSGEIQILDGYGDILINNNTPYDIAIERIDASQRGGGTLVLKDKAKAPGSYNFTTSNGNTSIAKDQTVFVQSGYSKGGTTGAVYSYLGPTTATLDLSNQDYRDASKWAQVPRSTIYSRDLAGALPAVDTTYTPASNWRYGFSVGMKTATRTTTTYGSSSWLGIDALAADPANIRSTSTEVLSQPVLSAAGTYFFKTATAEGNYKYQFKDIPTETNKYLLRKWQTKTWYGKKTNYQTWVNETKADQIGTHSFRADRPITINFIGETEADVTVNSTSGGRILIEGPIRNTTGTTTLNSSTSIIQTNKDEAIQGRKVVLTAGTGSSHTITDARVNLSEVGLFSLLATAGGNITITETLGAMAVDKVISTSGSTKLTAQDGITVASSTTQSPAIQGQSIVLNGGVGTLGTSNKALKLNTGTDVTSKLAANASGDIFLEEISSNLRIDQIISAQGNVSLTISNGTLIDGNTTARKDDRAYEALLNGVWTDLQLTASTGANSKITDTIATFSKSKEKEYQTYWNWRNRFTDVSKKVSVSRIETSSNTLLFNSAHGLQPGDAITITGNGLPPELISGETYFVHSVINSVQIKLSSTYLGSELDLTGNAIDFSDASVTTDIQPVAAFSTSQQISLTAEEDAFYRDLYLKEGADKGLTGSALNDYAQSAINTLVQSRTAQYNGLHNTFNAYNRGGYSAGDLTRKQYKNFSYTPTASETSALTSSIKIWKEEELLYSYSAGLMAEVSDTQTVIEDDNIRGNDVNIYAPNGGIGSFTTPVTIDLTRNPLNLTNDERVALSSAERADVVYLGGKTVSTTFNFTPDLTLGDTIARNDGGSWISDGYQAGLFLRVISKSRNSTADNAFWEILAVTPSTLRIKQKGTLVSESGRSATISQVVLRPMDSPIPLTAIEIAQRDDVDMYAVGKLVVSASNAVFVGSENDFFLKDINTQGILAVKTGDGIFNSSGHQSAMIVADDAVFEAASGGVGTSTNPLRVNLRDGASIAGRASDSIYITETLGNMLVDTFFSQRGAIELTTNAGSIVDNAGNDLVDLKAGMGIRLTANGGDIGEANDFLDIDQAESGLLNATASGSVYLWEAIGNSHLDKVQATTGNVFLKTHLSILDANAGAVNVVGNSINLEALVGGIGIAGDEIDINSRFSQNSGALTASSTFGNTYLNEIIGDLYLNTISTDLSSFGFITALAGSIFDGRSSLSTSNILSGLVYLFASQQIGTATSPIQTRMTNLEGKSSSGSMYVANTGALRIGGVAAAGPNGIDVSGNATITARSPITIAENVTVSGDLVFTAQDSINSGDNIVLEAGYSVQSLGGKVRFEAGDNLSLLVGSTVTAFSIIEALGNYGNSDSQATEIRLHGALIAPLTVIRGNIQNDTIVFESSASTQGVTVVEGNLGSDTITNNIATSSFTSPIIIYGDTLTVDYTPATRTINYFSTTTSGTGATDFLTNNGGFALFIGGAGADTLSGSAQADWMVGDEARVDFVNNRILRVSSSGSGIGASDNLSAGDGDNFVIGGFGGDSISAGLGVNNILGDEGIFEVDSSGNLLLAQSTNASVGAADLFTLGSGTYRIIAGAGDENIQLGPGNNFVIGDAGLIQVNGDGTLTVASLTPSVSGTDTITVSEGFNVVVGGSGMDSISVVTGTGSEAKANILGDNGSMLFSSTGTLLSITSLLNDTFGAADVVSLSSGTNAVIGGAGADVITAGGGKNTVMGDDGEAFFFNDGTIRLIQSINLGAGANDQITLNEGTNTVVGGFGADRLLMGGGTNYVMGDEAKLEVLTSSGVPTGFTVLESLNASVGGIDDIDVGAGRNIVVGGAA
ncbi:MAG: hypothetical protein ACKN85_07560, partial [Pirellula sp.]